jgi:hypothetical protein
VDQLLDRAAELLGVRTAHDLPRELEDGNAVLFTFLDLHLRPAISRKG